jgi:uncharacterized membrane-anchored protein
MNFKPTKWKVVWSIIIAILVWMLTFTSSFMPEEKRVTIISSLSSLIIVYVIWSIAQKRK